MTSRCERFTLEATLEGQSGNDTCILFCNGPQVVHWDRQAPGVGHDRADRLVDLYSSGEQRNYGSQFLQRKMNISSRAFTDGDFSLTVSDLQVCDSGETLRIQEFLISICYIIIRYKSSQLKDILTKKD